MKAPSAVLHMGCVRWVQPGEDSTGSSQISPSARAANRGAGDDRTHAGLVCSEGKVGGHSSIS